MTLAGTWRVPLFSGAGVAVVAVTDALPVTIALAWRADDLPAPATRLVEIAREVRAGEGLRALASATPARVRSAAEHEPFGLAGRPVD